MLSVCYVASFRENHVPVVYVVDVQGRVYRARKESFLGCNCLIDTLRLLLGLPGGAEVCDLVRHRLREEFPAQGPTRVTEGNCFTLDIHWKAAVRALALETGVSVKADDLQAVCVTVASGGRSGMVEGNGPRAIHVLNRGNNHFDPLFPVP